MNGLKELYNYREMILNLVRKDLRTRFKGSFLGFLWTFVNPLLQLIIYTIVFSSILRVNVDKFYIYLFVALVPWIFFTSAMQGGATSIVGNADLIKKIHFPRLVLPIATTTAAFMNMVYSMVIVLMALVFSGIGISWHIIFLPAIMILEYFFVLGITFLFAALNVYFRDLEHILGIITMVWFYLTPIVYTEEMVPKQYLGLFSMNPLTHLMGAYRDILYYHRIPDFTTLVSIVIFAVIFLVIGYFTFQKLQRNFVEEL